jgi:CHAD domain-containing protein
MPNAIQVGFFKDNLFELLTETFEQVHGRFLGRGTSLFETLQTISAEEASRPVSANCASLAAQVEHIRFYLEVVEHYLLGKEDRQWDWDEIWRTVERVTSAEWEAGQNRLRETYQRLRVLMESFDEWSDERIGETLNLLVHTAYHLGEIRQALCMLRNKG